MLETNIVTPKRNTGKDADIIEDFENMAQSIQEELNKKANNSITEDFDKKLENKVDKEQGKGLSTNDFTNILKEKLENLENYNDEDIRNILNSSLKEVKYTASNGILTFVANDGSVIKIDLPLELLVESGRYDEENRQIVLTLANGNIINIPVSNLLDDFYGKEKVDEMLAERDAKISDLEKENAEQAEELETLWKDYKEGEAKGETVSISDGIWRPKTTIYGMSKQNTTEGYQLVDTSSFTNQVLGGITFSKVAFGGIKISGTAENLVTCKISQSLNLKANTDYYIGGGYSNDISFDIRRTDGSAISGTRSITSDSNTKFTQTTDEENVNVTMRISSGITVDMTLYPLLSEVDKPFEPYTGGQASPNTEYEQDIEVITECSLVQRGKNILQVGSFKKSGLSGIEVTKLAENKFMLNGTSTSSGRILADTFNKNVGKQMTLTANRISGSSVNGGLQILVYIGKDSWSSCTTSQNIGQNDKITAQMNENGINSSTYQLGFFVAEGVTVNNLILEVQFEYGEESTEIEPPVEPITKEIDLQGKSIAKVGDIADLLNIGVNGSVKIGDKVIKEYVFTGKETIERYETARTDSYRFVIKGLGAKPNSSNDNIPNILCNSFIANTPNQNYLNVESISIASSGNIFIYSDITKAMTLTEFRAWLSENSIKVLYETAEPETITLPSIEPIKLIEGITNVFELITNLGTTMKIEYKVSNKSRLEALEQAFLLKA